MLTESKSLEQTRQRPSLRCLIASRERDILSELTTCENEDVQKRLEAILLYGRGRSISSILDEIGCSKSSLMNWCRAYRLNGIDGLYDHRSGGNNAMLSNEQIQALMENLRDCSPKDLLGDRTGTPEGEIWTVEDLYILVREWYGVTYKSRTSYYNLLGLCFPDGQLPDSIGCRQDQNSDELKRSGTLISSMSEN